jgi:hypothetical protein
VRRDSVFHFELIAIEKIPKEHIRFKFIFLIEIWYRLFFSVVVSKPEQINREKKEGKRKTPTEKIYELLEVAEKHHQEHKQQLESLVKLNQEMLRTLTASHSTSNPPTASTVSIPQSRSTLGTDLFLKSLLHEIQVSGKVDVFDRIRLDS